MGERILLLKVAGQAPIEHQAQRAGREVLLNRRSFGRIAVLCLVSTAAGCGPSSSPESQTPAVYHMYDHMARAAAVQQAVVMGHLDAARGPAVWLDNHLQDDDLPGNTVAYVAQMRTAAGQIALAPTVEEAGVHLGEMGVACGACHQALTLDVQVNWRPLPPSDGEVEAHMIHHQWAMDRLWEGLMGPSDEAWKAGADALSEPGLHISRTTAEAGRRHRAESWDALAHRLGETANSGLSAPEKAELYGELIGACYGCHQLLEVTAYK